MRWELPLDTIFIISLSAAIGFLVWFFVLINSWLEDHTDALIICSFILITAVVYFALGGMHQTINQWSYYVTR